MRRIFARTRLEAPYLLSERGALWLSRDLRGAGGAPGLGEGPRRDRRSLEGTLSEVDLEGVSLSAVAGPGVVLDGGKARGSSWSRCQLGGATLRALAAEDSHWDVVDLTGATLEDVSAPGARFCLTSLRGASLRGCDLRGATFVLCDFTAADLQGVDLRDARLLGCEVDDSTLVDVRLDGADIGGSSFQRALLEGVSMEGVLAAGSDLRGALGVLDPEGLKAAGARVGGGGLLRLWARVLGAGPEAHRRALKATSATWAALAILVPLLFFGRAILWPINPDAPPGQEVADDPE